MAPRSELPVLRDNVDIREEGRRDDRYAAQRDVELLARWMDSVFEIPIIGFRFGLDAIIGLLPGAGDVVTSFASIYILNAARKFGVPRVTLTRMTLNIAIDLIGGALPFVGDLWDAWWKANQRNADLLRRHIESTPNMERKLQTEDRWFVTMLIAFVVLLTIGSVAVAVLLFKWLVEAISQAGG
jgi:hypothetical protein